MRRAFHTSLNQSSVIRNGICEVAHIHRLSRDCTRHLRKRFIWVGTKSPSESSECPFCPFCPISMRWAFHTNLNQQSSIMLSGLCEVAHLHRHSRAYTQRVRKQFTWVSTNSIFESSECPFCPFCPISKRWAFHTILNLNQRSKQCNTKWVLLSGTYA